MKITIVSQEEWNTKDRQTGEPITGYSFVGFLPNGNVIKFTSKRTEHVAHVGQVGFDPQLAEDVEIRTKEFGGKIRYQEIEPELPE